MFSCDDTAPIEVDGAGVWHDCMVCRGGWSRGCGMIVWFVEVGGAGVWHDCMVCRGGWSRGCGMIVWFVEVGGAGGVARLYGL